MLFDFLLNKTCSNLIYYVYAKTTHMRDSLFGIFPNIIIPYRV